MKYYEVRNNLEQSLPMQLPNGKQVILPRRNYKMSVKLTEEQVNFQPVQNLKKQNIIKVKEL